MHGFLELSLQLLQSFNAVNFVQLGAQAQVPIQGEESRVKPTPIIKSSSLPDYFITDDGHFQGPTQTGDAPFLAQTNLAPFAGVSYIPNTPLETQIPIVGNVDNQNIFQSLANISPYFPNPRGFGVNEYSIPPGSNVTWLNMIHRHGSRYPEFSGDAAERTLGLKIAAATGKFTGHGALTFLNDWKFMLGAEILVPNGKQELFTSGTLHYYQYGHLYPNNGSKIVVRSTTQRRMTESAEYFLAGFFGLGWTQNATLELAIEWPGFNNTLAGYKQCNRTSWKGARGALNEWVGVYLHDAHQRFKANISGDLDWTLSDTYNAQALCSYETVALGFSHWCGLFTFKEWEGYEYALDIGFQAGAGFGSPVGRAVGVGYVEEVLARMLHHIVTSPSAQINLTLDNNTVTFPVDQNLNLDFAHDVSIISILTAFGLTQFAESLPLTHIKTPREFILSHIQPFAGRLDIEIIKAPAPVNPDRSDKKIYVDGGPTSYVHFILNQRTVPLGRSHKECGERDDGWCEMETFVEVIKREIEGADYEYACFGEWEQPGYGKVKDGRPIREE